MEMGFCVESGQEEMSVAIVSCLYLHLHNPAYGKHYDHGAVVYFAYSVARCLSVFKQDVRD